MEAPENPIFEAVSRGLGGALLGACIGVVFLGVGLLRAVIAMARGTHVVMEGLWPEAGIYILGFVFGGAVMGALWPTQPTRGRQYLAGVLGGVVVVAFVARIVEGPVAAWTLGSYVMIAVLGSLFGMAFTWGLR